MVAKPTQSCQQADPESQCSDGLATTDELVIHVVAVALPQHPGHELRFPGSATEQRPESARVSFPASRRVLLALDQRELPEAKQCETSWRNNSIRGD